MAYTTIDDSSVYFQTALYTGNGGTQSITNDGNSDLQPDWIWIKTRSDATYHSLSDSVLGTDVQLGINDSNAADAFNIAVTAFNSDGFSLGSNGNTNTSSRTFAAWQWKAGTSFTNDASSTGVGTIDSTGSTSATSRFSIVKYTSTGSTGTVAHNLGVTPNFIVIKRLEDSGYDWTVYHTNKTAGLYFNTTDYNADSSSANIFGRSPTSTVFSVTADGRVGGNTTGKTYIAYCFADVKGFSKFGSYTGNGNANGQFVYTGFKPAFVIGKRTDATNNWYMYDNKRDTFNPTTQKLRANTTAAEATGTDKLIDMLSNGFKMRSTDAEFNASGGTYIYLAFAENPFVTGASAIPTHAR